MPLDKRTNEFSSHKHKYNVYVDLNTKTKLGQDLLGQYREQSKYHYMDIGRIGSHDEYGRYKIDYYTTKELIVVPKLIIRVIKQAMDRAGRDIYQLRTYMSKFGQLNFLLIVDKDKADLVLVENVYIENLNHKEDYETTLWRISYYNQKPVPLKEIFYKFGIKANPDDYGKSWKEEDVSINNVIVSKAKAEMTKQIANKIASEVNQKALVTSLNYLNKEGEFGKKITSAYSKTVSSNKEINKLATSPKLESTLNHVLIKTVEAQTTKKDLTDNYNFRVYKKVLDVQLSCPNQIAQNVKSINTKQNLKSFLIEAYQKPKNIFAKVQDENEIFKQKQDEFEQIINHKYERKVNIEKSNINEEVFDKSKIKNKVDFAKFKDFDNKEIDINLAVDRFFNPEEKSKKKQREKEERLNKKEERKLQRLKNKEKRKLRKLNAECDINAEFEKSKTVLGLEPEDLKKSKKIKLNKFFENKKQKDKAHSKGLKGKNKEQSEDELVIKKLEKRIKKQASKNEKLEEKQNKKALKEEKKAEVKKHKLESKEKNHFDEEKKNKINNFFKAKKSEEELELDRIKKREMTFTLYEQHDQDMKDFREDLKHKEDLDKKQTKQDDLIKNSEMLGLQKTPEIPTKHDTMISTNTNKRISRESHLEM